MHPCVTTHPKNHSSIWENTITIHVQFGPIPWALLGWISTTPSDISLCQNDINVAESGTKNLIRFVGHCLHHFSTLSHRSPRQYSSSHATVPESFLIAARGFSRLLRFCFALFFWNVVSFQRWKSCMGGMQSTYCASANVSTIQTFLLPTCRVFKRSSSQRVDYSTFPPRTMCDTSLDISWFGGVNQSQEDLLKILGLSIIWGRCPLPTC